MNAGSRILQEARQLRVFSAKIYGSVPCGCRSLSVRSPLREARWVEYTWSGKMRGAWDPRRALRERPHVLLRFDLLDGDLMGMCEKFGAQTIITLDRRLDFTERTAVLSHELVHDERGGSIDYCGAPKHWDAVVAREERIVDAEVARRLIPPDALDAFVAARESLDEGVSAADVAQWFDVPVWVARDALTPH